MFNKILATVDLAQPGPGSKTLATAAALAGPTGAEVRLIYVRFMLEAAVKYIPAAALADEERKAVADLLDLGKKQGIAEGKLSAVSPMGNVTDQVLAAAAAFGADLIVTGPHSGSLSKFLLGLNAQRIALTAPVSVLIAR